MKKFLKIFCIILIVIFILYLLNYFILSKTDTDLTYIIIKTDNGIYEDFYYGTTNHYNVFGRILIVYNGLKPIICNTSKEYIITIYDENYNYLYVSSELVSETFQNLAEFYKSYY